jgi:hypothetical protein
VRAIHPSIQSARLLARVSPGPLACAPFQTTGVPPTADKPTLNNVQFTRQEKNPEENKVGEKRDGMTEKNRTRRKRKPSGQGHS